MSDRATDILDLDLRPRRRKGEPFALATVVRTVAATAAKAGAKAVILPDGTISEGWIGGGCARAAVLKAAREALADGKSRLVSVQPPDAAAGAGRRGRRGARRRALRQEHVPEPGHHGHVRRAGAAAAADRRLRVEPGGGGGRRSRPAASASPSRSARLPPSRRPSREADRRIEGYALPVDGARARASSSSRRRDAATRRRCRRRSRSMPTTSPSSAAARRPRR